jgi:hypothetical protein
VVRRGAVGVVIAKPYVGNAVLTSRHRCRVILRG